MSGEIIRFGKLVSAEPRMTQVLKLLEDIAPTDATVLLLGESGTGKELLARAVHENSKRSSKPFVAVNCSAIPIELIESQLFGHMKGSFTGAVANMTGKFEEADGGTLFLDEIGDMSQPMQAKILRALETREIQPVGANKTIKVNLRLIAATNKDLEEAVAKKEFRNDLFYRINEVTVNIPPLRERHNDLHLILSDIIRECNQEMGKCVTSVSVAVLGLLQKHHWPGNVRELRNIIRRAMLLTSPSTDQIFVEHMPVQFVPDLAASNGSVPLQAQAPQADQAAAGAPSLLAPEELVTLEEIEKRYISFVIDKSGGNKSKAARTLGIDRTTLYEKIRKYGLEPQA